MVPYTKQTLQQAFDLTLVTFQPPNLTSWPFWLHAILSLF